MKTWFTRAVFGLTLGALTAVHAQETIHRLSDLNKAGEWVSEQWDPVPSKLEVRPEFPAELRGQGGEETSLGVKVNWPGGENFVYCNLVPAAAGSLKVPFRASALSLWVRGSGTGHYLDLHVIANGQPMKLELGQMTYDTWRKLEVAIPTDWAQPLTVKGIAIHSWGLPQAVISTCYFPRLEAKGDASQPLP